MLLLPPRPMYAGWGLHEQAQCRITIKGVVLWFHLKQRGGIRTLPTA